MIRPIRPSEIARRLRAKRARQRLTQAELARRLRVSQASISKYESGRVPGTALHRDRILRYLAAA